ncbi:hypothetical protein CHH91_19870, partial [Virgibacillus sp. 7505]
VKNNALVQQEIQRVEEAMAGEGRILVRPSGTEPLVRVMVEAKTDELCQQYANQIVDVVKEQLGA